MLIQSEEAKLETLKFPENQEVLATETTAAKYQNAIYFIKFIPLLFLAGVGERDILFSVR